MFLEQICPGQVNSHPQALHTFVFEDDRFIVYATGSKVVIYIDPDNLAQVITASSLFTEQQPFVPITAVCGNSKTGEIAVSYSNEIAVLKPFKQENGIKWVLSTILDSSCLVTCLDWSLHNFLLCAGEEILLFSYNDAMNSWNKIFKRKPATNIVLAKFEPQSNVFATIGKVGFIVHSYIACIMRT
ncbi:hypothetical protein BDF20DRAFT_708277 [Mycotypha africana]|uniref:uncharacterized protein n=1 Tax=Mycotypha africana TaxID=64632 RepID=UPI00230097BE|nr:uncharacterized protein BDF20DRAFT_708277 [Mycotypha africana]KAI8971921.1 hypothetical protein BDF20DRAFT_708277 [Mycotypha africana]